MISYKTWRILQENLGQTNLGVKSPNIVGTTESPLFGMMKKKKGPPPDMFGGDDMGDEDHGDENGDEDDMGDEDHGDEDDMGDEDHGDEDDMGDEDHGDEDGDEGDMGDEDQNGDEDDHDMDDMGDEDHGDEDGDEGDEDQNGGDMGGPPKKKFGAPMAKPPMPMAKPPMKMSYMKKEGKDTLKMKMGGKKCCSNCSKMKTEDNEFLTNLRSMTGGTKFAVDDEGYWVPIDEDALISPNTKNDNEPGPGEVGYAPAQKVATNFQEWATKHVKKTRK